MLRYGAIILRAAHEQTPHEALTRCLWSCGICKTKTTPPKAEQKRELSVMNKIQVVYLCIYVRMACYSLISLINGQSLPCFKTTINYKEYRSCAGTVILPRRNQGCGTWPWLSSRLLAMLGWRLGLVVTH